jgi:phosphate transport system protein
MERHFDQKLEDLKMKVLEMGAASERALAKAITAVQERDSSLAADVIENDCTINELQDQIDEASLIMLAREQPVAQDLRFLIGSMHVAVNLERIGDQAVNIGERAMLFAQRPPLDQNPSFDELVAHIQEMVKMALQAFNKMDPEQAQKVCEMDSQADQLNLRVLKQYVDFMVQESKTIERAVHAILCTRSLERVGDLATNICEYVIFIVKGVNVKARCHRV